jgi:2-oxoglutarate dehydrogenase E2 component (dihydrolipoamide succinyltransferase)
MRRSIAEHMVRSLHTAAHCTSIAEADFSGVESARCALGITHLPFVARAVIDALRVHPDLNATLDGESLTLHRAVHLGVAISLGRDGLIVPVIRDAHELAPEGLARRVSELAERARAGRLSPDEVRGGTFTITNPGGFGTLASTPIINQPQVAILDLEAVVKRPVVVTDGAGRDSIAIRPMAYLCLSWDHRALDGALAAQFLATVRARIESWDAA